MCRRTLHARITVSTHIARPSTYTENTRIVFKRPNVHKAAPPPPSSSAHSRGAHLKLLYFYFDFNNSGLLYFYSHFAAQFLFLFQSPRFSVTRRALSSAALYLSIFYQLPLLALRRRSRVVKRIASFDSWSLSLSGRPLFAPASARRSRDTRRRTASPRPPRLYVTRRKSMLRDARLSDSPVEPRYHRRP